MSLLSELRKEGFNVREDWMRACIDYTRSNSRNAIVAQLLCSDISDWSARSIPNNFNSMHKEQWMVQYVLQIEENINLCAASFEEKNRNKSQNPKLLRLKLTDGASNIYAIIYQFIEGLSLDTKIGSKIAIKDAFVRRGYLMLTPLTAHILNGFAPKKKKMQNKKRQNIQIEYDQPSAPRRLTQKEKLCGFGAQRTDSLFIGIGHSKLGKTKEWNCSECTYLHKNKDDGICEVCGHKNEIVKIKKEKMEIERELDSMVIDEDDSDLNFLHLLSTANNANERNRRKIQFS